MVLKFLWVEVARYIWYVQIDIIYQIYVIHIIYMIFNIQNICNMYIRYMQIYIMIDLLSCIYHHICIHLTYLSKYLLIVYLLRFYVRKTSKVVSVVAVHIHSISIVLPHCETRLPASWDEANQYLTYPSYVKHQAR